MPDITGAELPEDKLYIVLSPGSVDEGFQVAIYNRIQPANVELLCLARGLVELLASSTQAVFMVGQNAINEEFKDNTDGKTIEGEAIDLDAQKEITVNTDLSKVEPAGRA